MELHVIQAYSDFLSNAFTDRAFEASKVINGVQEQQPRWKRAVATISGNLGETIGKLYVKDYFPETSKQRVYRLVKDLPMIDTWYEAFGIQPTDKMFIPKEKRALVW